MPDNRELSCYLAIKGKVSKRAERKPPYKNVRFDQARNLFVVRYLLE